MSGRAKEENRKVITLCYMIGAALVWLTFGILVDTFAATWGVLARLVGQDWFRHGVAAGLGLVVFLVLQFNSTVNVWADEVVSEIRKVVWPSRRDTGAMTVVVCVFLLFTGTLVGIFDLLSAYIVNLFIVG